MVEHIIEQTAQKVKENQNLQNTDYLDAEGLSRKYVSKGEE